MPKLLTLPTGNARDAKTFGVGETRTFSAAEWHRTGAHLLNQQLWCWGQDLRGSEGGWLVRHGFRRIAKPAGQDGSSIYHLQLNDRQGIVLRGFGVFVGDDLYGGMFLKRFEFSPWITPSSDLPAPAWQASDLPRLTRPACDQELANCQRLLAHLIDWTCDYERWVRRVAGAEYRRCVVEMWIAMKKARPTPSHCMTRTWRRLQAALFAQGVRQPYLNSQSRATIAHYAS